MSLDKRLQYFLSVPLSSSLFFTTIAANMMLWLWCTKELTSFTLNLLRFLWCLFYCVYWVISQNDDSLVVQIILNAGTTLKTIYKMFQYHVTSQKHSKPATCVINLCSEYCTHTGLRSVTSTANMGLAQCVSF